MHALIVDDAASMRALIRRALEANACTVIAEAATASDALIHAATQPDVIVLDGRLPPDGAVPLIATLREAAPKAAIYVIATLDERNLVRDAVKAGARGAFERPLRARRIAEALAELQTGESGEATA